MYTSYHSPRCFFLTGKSTGYKGQGRGDGVYTTTHEILQKLKVSTMENVTELPMCVNCEEKEVAEKGMMLCDDCIIHLEGHI